MAAKASRRTRRWLWLPVLTLFGAGAIAFGAHSMALGKVESSLTARGLSWADRADRLTGATWTDVSGPGLRIEQLDIELFPAIDGHIQGVAIDLKGAADVIGREDGDASGNGMPSTAKAVSLRASDVSVRLGDRDIVKGLNGTILPEVDLTGPEGFARRQSGEWNVSFQAPLKFDVVTGNARIEAWWTVGSEAGARFRVLVSDAVFEHPMLAAGPLKPMVVSATGTAHPETGEVRGVVRMGQVPVPFDFQTRDNGWDLTLAPEDTPVRSVVELFAGHIALPEDATIEGTLGGTAKWSSPGGVWRLSPTVSGLRSTGLVQNAALKRGAFRPDWIPIGQARGMAHAVMAAEDAAFMTHPGYDLSSIQEVLEEAARKGTRPENLRGASTVTQQLAKNLFLSGERTLARKLHELLYTVELERTLGKHRIMELYLNVVEFGPDIYGLGPAADAYFLKAPERMELHEQVFLAAILPAPKTWYTRAHFENRLPRARMRVILDNMVRLGTASPEQAAAAKAASLRLVPPAREP